MVRIIAVCDGVQISDGRDHLVVSPNVDTRSGRGGGNVTPSLFGTGIVTGSDERGWGLKSATVCEIPATRT